MARHHLMTSVKNEAVYLLEWIAHHKATGFDQIFITANDCNDGTVRLLRVLHQHGFVKFCRNDCTPDQIPQHQGYKVLRRRFDVNDCDWLMILDVDEFLFVAVGDRTIGALTAKAADDVDVIALNALNFGTAAAPKPGERVTKRFQYRLREQDRKNATLKSITRNPARFKDAHNHHLTQPEPDTGLMAMRGDASTFAIPEKAKLWGVLRSSPEGKIAHNLGFYAHYAIKSRVEYQQRQRRGRGAVPASSLEQGRHSDAYFLRRAKAKVLDTRMEHYDEPTLRWLDQMLDIPEIRAVQTDVEQTFFRRLEKLRK